MFGMSATVLGLWLAAPSRAQAAAPPPKPPKPAAAAPAAPAAVGLSVSTPPASVADVLARFEALDRELSGLTAAFAQSITMTESGVSQNVEGTVQYLKPDRLRLEHRKPERQSVVSDGKAVWIHRHAHNQVIQSDLQDWRKADPLLNGLMDFGGYSQMLRRYDVSYSSATREVTLRPKDKTAAFALVLRLSGKHHFPAESELQVAQMKVRTVLSDLKFNPELRDSEFAFEPPPGADVFRNFKPPQLRP